MTNQPSEFNINDPSLVPTEKDWLTIPDIDVELAQEKFGGKTISQAATFILEARYDVSEYLAYMPPVPFRYYIRAYIELLKSPELFDKPDCGMLLSDAADSLISLVSHALKTKPARVLPAMEEIMPIIELIAAHPRKYLYDEPQDDNSVWNTIAPQCDEIRELYEQVKAKQEI